MVQDGDDSREAKVFGAHAAPQGLCDKLIDALKLLSNQQRDGDSLVASIVTGLREKSRKGIMTDPGSSSKWSILRQGTKSVEVVELRFIADFPEAVIREGAEELTLRVEEVGSRRTFIDSTHVEAERWGAPLVDADWHVCLSSHVPRNRWTRMGNHLLLFQGSASAVRKKKLAASQKAKALWSMKEAKRKRRPNPSERHSSKTSKPVGLVGRTPKQSGGSSGEGVRNVSKLFTNVEALVHSSPLSRRMSSTMAVSAACAKRLLKVWKVPCSE